MILAPIPLARYHFTARWLDDVRLPDYAGSLLRGQFGAALRRLACMTRQPSCPCCPLLTTCPYTRIFEAPPPATPHPVQQFSTIPNAYVIEPPAMTSPVIQAAGELLHFDMVLAGDALAQLPLVIVAWQRALAQGLTRERSRAELLAVDWADADGGEPLALWQHDAPQLQPHQPGLNLPPAPATEQLCLHIHTPMRLQQQGHPLGPAELNPRALVSAVARRVALMLDFHAGQPDWGQRVPPTLPLADTLSDQRHLRWHDWVRYSSRQRQEMTLGGVLGRWTLHGPADTLAALWPWLWLGQWLHVGKNATMGMGRYTLQTAPQGTPDD
jgi:hypothetical protein